MNQPDDAIVDYQYFFNTHPKEPNSFEATRLIYFEINLLMYRTRLYSNINLHIVLHLLPFAQINNIIEPILRNAGYDCVDFLDKHLCCGSAGTYSLLQPSLATQLKKNKINNIMKSKPDVIATANIGCLLHLQSDTTVPVKHWLELVDIQT